MGAIKNEMLNIQEQAADQAFIDADAGFGRAENPYPSFSMWFPVWEKAYNETFDYAEAQLAVKYNQMAELDQPLGIYNDSIGG